MTSAVTDASLARVRALLARGDERARLRAILRVRQCGSRTLLPLLLERLESESAPPLLAGILGTLAELATGAQVPTISLYLSHPDHRVVKEAVRALDRAGSEDVLPLLMSLLNRPDARIVERALVALERANPEHLVEVLRAMARNSRPAVRERLLEYLRLVRASEVEELLIEMIEEEPADRAEAMLAVLGGRATARSAAALRGLSTRLPELAPRIARILALIASRSSLSLSIFELAP